MRVSSSAISATCSCARVASLGTVARKMANCASSSCSARRDDAPSAMRRPSRPVHGAHDVQVVGRPLARIPRPLALPPGTSASAVRTRLGKARSPKKTCMNSSAQGEDEVVLTLAAVAGIALPAALPLAALRFANAVAAHVLVAAGVHHLAAAAFTMVEHRLGQIPLRDADVLALLQLTDAAAARCTARAPASCSDAGSAHGCRWTCSCPPAACR